MRVRRLEGLSSRPIIVCGVPRSGTSLTRDLLNSHPKVIILDEFPFSQLPSTFSLMKELRTLVGGFHESWRGLGPQEIEERLAWWLGSTWAAVSRDVLFHRFLARGVSRFGMKTPSAELFFDQLQAHLGQNRPQLIFCIRDPLAVYVSLLGVPWGAHYLPEKALELFLASRNAALSIQEKDPGCLFVLNIDRANRSFRERLLLAKKLFRFLGLRLAAKSVFFCLRWPPVNRRDPRKDADTLSHEERGRRLEAMKILLGNTGDFWDPLLARIGPSSSRPSR